jgi:multidrug resistance efflux pump
MRLRTILPAFAVLSGLAAHAQEALPSRATGEKPDAEPKLFLNDLGDALPAAEDLDLTALANDSDVERAKADHERAQRKQQRWQKLGKAGVLSQVEVEAAVLQLAHARAKYEQARAAQQQKEVEALRTRVAAGQVTKDALDAAESALQTAQAIAAEAVAGLQRTQLLQAEANLERQRRLAAAGVGAKGMVERAKAKLQQLKAKSD